MGGPIPSWLGQMPFLEQLWMGAILYEGTIPPFIGNISSLTLLAIYSNSLTGNIPKSLGQLSRLTAWSFSDNYLTGSLPAELGNLSNLQLGRVYGNSLSGSIPTQFGRLKSLQQFEAQYNNFSGRIPPEMSNCSVLGLLRLQSNQLSGGIPSQLGRLRFLAELHLEQNLLSGTIPGSLSNCTNLQDLSLGYNLLHGNIPPAIASLRNIVHSFSMPCNLLNGKIPAEIGGMQFVTVVDLAGNHLSGEIPATLGNCVEMLKLNLSNNQLGGRIPQTFGTLITLTNLDLSVNNLSGPIPSYIGDMGTLLLLNLSYNHLSGPIPTRGVFKNQSAIDLSGNSDLCSSECPKSAAQSSSGISNRSKFLIIVGSFAFGALVLTAMVYLYVRRRRKSKDESEGQRDLFLVREIVKLNHSELFHATSEFSNTNIIGSGRMATVYSGRLNISGTEQAVAVKRFKDEIAGSVAVTESLIAEIRALALTKHRNLVCLLGYCWAPRAMALVMEMMPNRTLAEHIQEKTLSWSVCLRIARGVAEGLKYLHHECPQPVLHCDLKPSNILLGMDFEPGIADFGISRILNYDDMSRGFSTSNLQGSIGYMPPEYALSGRLTARGDVYSYGVVILEMISGKNPTSEMFREENTLPEWALRTSVDGTPFEVIATHFHIVEGAAEERERNG
ncbi:LRR receptor-like serine/threonine-protein kinase RGI1 [Cryptomeria japonica]|uniref:LRR receptor-like serine/threonine-protein kinase RGI1 n=1 Tax=Cryptomeria japonica TaxID=3369 RepID=UPI0027DA2B5F|nr:LRR receptor-like serine/threonine-protein kinase RGI1 [Cryptomeria japonica]